MASIALGLSIGKCRRSQASTLVNARATYKYSKDTRLTLDVLNLFNRIVKSN